MMNLRGNWAYQGQTPIHLTMGDEELEDRAGLVFSYYANL